MAPDLSDTGRQSLDNSGVMRAMALEAAGLPGGPGPHWVDARLLCKAGAQRVASRAARQNVVVKLSANEEPAVVIGFAPMLLKALELLADNALAAMPTGGTLKFRVYKDPYVIIECIDTGSGDGTVAPAAPDGGLDHMTRSWRAQPAAAPPPSEPAGKREARLDAAREIILSHRGCLWTRPSGSGTSVILELPSAGGSTAHKPWRKG
jgi:hypothetical protein